MCNDDDGCDRCDVETRGSRIGKEDTPMYVYACIYTYVDRNGLSNTCFSIVRSSVRSPI